MPQREERTDKRMNCRVHRVLTVTLLAIVITSLTAFSGDSKDGTRSLLLTENEPIANSMSVFTAHVGSDSIVLLAWETSTESDADGFHLYRVATEGGHYVQMTTPPIPAKGGEKFTIQGNVKLVQIKPTEKCVGGTKNGDPCFDSSECPDACEGGARAGLVCHGATECPDACEGGTRAGLECFYTSGSFDCPGGACSDRGGCTNKGRCLPSPPPSPSQ